MEWISSSVFISIPTGNLSLSKNSSLTYKQYLNNLTNKVNLSTESLIKSLKVEQSYLNFYIYFIDRKGSLCVNFFRIVQLVIFVYNYAYLMNCTSLTGCGLILHWVSLPISCPLTHLISSKCFSISSQSFMRHTITDTLPFLKYPQRQLNSDPWSVTLLLLPWLEWMLVFVVGCVFLWRLLMGLLIWRLWLLL